MRKESAEEEEEEANSVRSFVRSFVVIRFFNSRVEAERHVSRSDGREKKENFRKRKEIARSEKRHSVAILLFLSLSLFQDLNVLNASDCVLKEPKKKTTL